MDELKYIFGPVPSRRLGRSLGINVIPSKICDLNCLYCEAGPTKALTLARRPYCGKEKILAEFNENFSRFKNNIDVITITGAGEPTLNSDLDGILEGIRKVAGIPVAILTNATTFYCKDVYDVLLKFDIVAPSLDAVTPDVFKKINMPHKDLSVEDMVLKLRDFTREYKGRLLLEILLCKGINDGERELVFLAEAMKDMKLTKVQVGTVFRPPAYGLAQPVSDEKLLEAVKYFRSRGLPAEVSGGFQAVFENVPAGSGLESLIISLSKMRPCTLADYSGVFGEDRGSILRAVKNLEDKKIITAASYGGDIYYSHSSLNKVKNGK